MAEQTLTQEFTVFDDETSDNDLYYEMLQEEKLAVLEQDMINASVERIYKQNYLDDLFTDEQ